VLIFNRLDRRRDKVFGYGRPRALDRNAKARIMAVAASLMLRKAEGKAYGKLTAKACAVLKALLWGFHNARSGLCFPSYEKIAERADCARSTVAEALKALEGSGILSWVNRLARVRVWNAELGKAVVRVIRTSNAYEFHDPKPALSLALSSKSDFPTGTNTQVSSLAIAPPKTLEIKQPTELDNSIAIWKAKFKANQEARR